MTLSSLSSRNPGFTLIEVMIVVTIVGLLAAIAVQTFRQVKSSSRATIITNDLRLLRDAFQLYALEYGKWPDAANAGETPPEMKGAVQDLGIDRSYGQWRWVPPQIQLTTLIDDPEVMQKVDKQIDDGNLATGNFQGSGVSFTLTLE